MTSPGTQTLQLDEESEVQIRTRLSLAPDTTVWPTIDYELTSFCGTCKLINNFYISVRLHSTKAAGIHSHEHPVDGDIEHQRGGRFPPDKDLLGEFYPAPVGTQLLVRLAVQFFQLSLRECLLFNSNTAVCIRTRCGHVQYSPIGPWE